MLPDQFIAWSNDEDCHIDQDSRLKPDVHFLSVGILTEQAGQQQIDVGEGNPDIPLKWQEGIDNQEQRFDFVLLYTNEAHRQMCG